jgi:acetyl-CoA carboxylase carboxyltransferase component
MSSDWPALIRGLEDRRAAAQVHGGPEAVGRLHSRGKMAARERIDALLDRGSFREIGLHAEGVVQTPGKPATTVRTDAVVCGWGEIDGRRVLVVADDGSVMGGAAGIVNIEKRFRMRRIAIEQGYPFIGLYEGSAIRFQDSMDAAILARVPAFKEVADTHGVCPQVAAIFGPCYGRPPFDVLCSDFAVMAKGTGFLGLSGPSLVQGGLGEIADINELSGPEMHALTTGLVDRVAADEVEALALIRRFLSFMPPNAWTLPPRGEDDKGRADVAAGLERLVPTDFRKPYDMRKVVAALGDDGDFFEYKPDFGTSLITCLARLGGQGVGIVASQPLKRGGVLDWAASMKGRRFVSVCNQFHIPLVFLQDQPGFLPGKQSEAANILYWAGTFLMAVQKATVPKLTVVLRKSHGAALWAMGVGGEYNDGADLVAAWPSAVMTGTGPSSAVFTVHSKELKAAADPQQLQQELESNYTQTGSIYRAAAAFGVHAIIPPGETRAWLIDTLALASGKLGRNLQPKTPLFP